MWRPPILLVGAQSCKVLNGGAIELVQNCALKQIPHSLLLLVIVHVFADAVASPLVLSFGFIHLQFGLWDSVFRWFVWLAW